MSKRLQRPRQCIVPGCDRLPKGNGLCPAHYRKQRLYGDPLEDRTHRRRTKPSEDPAWLELLERWPTTT
jgi:hypothetical protein